jgi:HTH-type transcriptional regulator/antitoxin HigA
MKVLANPVEMIRSGAPRVIRDDRELRAYTQALFALTAKNRPSKVELDAIDLLTLLVTEYEARARTLLPSAAPLDVLRYLMEKHGLSQRDLAADIGSESLVSLLLSGKRNLTTAHMHAFARRFHVPASVFLGSPGRRMAA